ncbi:uncharacterized protein LOC120202716 [Hibiscus syriacus]|uniref:uncharacterized protein LOC120202716 n=1 Tax=Hibiscus syriacus TaxID=106335 RepID=UPI001924B13F|nr:uncharacterized protein LOC120202716 [Hibiscus syriacus]XP_039059038.1 uncharacterized protein LOC120202716 [Hibiscus syriacus]
MSHGDGSFKYINFSDLPDDLDDGFFKDINFSDLLGNSVSVPPIGDQVQQPENAPFEVQSGANEPPISTGDNQENSSSRKRDWDVVSPNSSDAKGKRPRRQSRRRGTDFTGESSTPGEPEKTTEEASTFAERIKPLTVGESAKLLINRINQRMKSVREIQLNLLRTHSHIKTQWSMAAQVQEMVKDDGAIKAEIQKFIEDMVATEGEIQRFMENMYATESKIQIIKQDITKIPKNGKLTEAAAKQKLIGMENKELNKFLQDLQDARKMYKQILQEKDKIDEKIRELQPFFLNNMSTSEIPSDIKEMDDQNQDEGGLSTLVDDSQTKFSHFKNQFLHKENNEVDFQDFEGLQEALNGAGWGVTPDYLEHIAMEIETAIGMQINNPRIRVLLSAATKEMKDMRVEEMELDMSSMFKKWAATLNSAKEDGFHAEFAYHKLEKILRLYFFYHENLEGKNL